MAKDPKYVLELSPEQARVVIDALDVYSRLGAGQMEEALVFWRFRTKTENIEPARQIILGVKMLITGLGNGANLGIHSKELPIEYKRAYDVQQVLRHAIAHEEKFERVGTWHSAPRSVSGEILPKISVKETKEKKS